MTQVSTCDSVSVNITNGQKPYTVSVVPGIVAAVPQNFTLGDDDDAFTYVNRIPTGNFFISESLHRHSVLMRVANANEICSNGSRLVCA